MATSFKVVPLASLPYDIAYVLLRQLDKHVLMRYAQPYMDPAIMHRQSKMLILNIVCTNRLTIFKDFSFAFLP